MVTKSRPKKRVPVSGNRDILTVSNKDPNFVYRWVNDEPGRIKKFEEAGYEIVSEDVGDIGDQTVNNNNKSDNVSVKTKVVGVNREIGKVQNAYLMKIPKEWYDEDQAKKQEEVNRVDQAMRDKNKEPGFYGRVKIDGF